MKTTNDYLRNNITNIRFDYLTLHQDFITLSSINLKFEAIFTINFKKTTSKLVNSNSKNSFKKKEIPYQRPM